MGLLLVGLLGWNAEANCPVVNRSMKVKYQFLKETGYPKGRKGYVVDHIIPLCAGGADTVENMQWQLLANSYRKDRLERDFCHTLWLERN